MINIPVFVMCILLVLRSEVRAALFCQRSASSEEIEMETLHPMKQNLAYVPKTPSGVSSLEAGETDTRLQRPAAPREWPSACLVFFFAAVTIGVLYAGLLYTLYIKPTREEAARNAGKILGSTLSSLSPTPSGASALETEIRAALATITAATESSVEEAAARIAALLKNAPVSAVPETTVPVSTVPETTVPVSTVPF